MKKTKQKREEKIMGKNKKEKGITLVSLVITIIIIIILSTVTINMAFGENGLITQAQKARDMTANSVAAEQEGMNNVMSEYLNVMAEDGEIPEPNLPEEPTKSEVEQAKDNGTKYTETMPIKDDLDNTVYIPGGFHIAGDSATKVEGGIVIEDDSGNQFVWIPTGTYNVSTEINSAGTLTNELSRRQWGTTKDVVKEPTLLTDDEVAEGFEGKVYYGEGDGRSVASSQIGAFLNSAKPVAEGGKGGFYIGRYEQGTGNVCKAGVDAYTNVTRNIAKSQAEAMYSGKTGIKATSELISSYAWDTALNFMCQTNIGEGKGYALATTTSQDRANIGTGGKTQTGKYEADDYSNIHDLLGNCYEWTTEYSDYSANSYTYPCVDRGGRYSTSGLYAAFRNYGTAEHSSSLISFRLQLYV